MCFFNLAERWEEIGDSAALFFLQRMRPAAEERSRGRQRKVAGDKEHWAFFCKGRNQLRLRPQTDDKRQFLPEGSTPFKRRLNPHRETMYKTLLHLTQIVSFIRYMCFSISSEVSIFHKLNNSPTSILFQIASIPFKSYLNSHS
jgi:hypothetical protein